MVCGAVSRRHDLIVSALSVEDRPKPAATWDVILERVAGRFGFP